MLFRENLHLPNGRFLLSAACAWVLSAAALLLAATLIANAAGLGERGLGILSSAISFLAAASAGFFAARRQRGSNLLGALVAATALVIALLTVGLLIKGEDMDASAILSIVSFTYAGVLLGVMLRPRGKSQAKRRRYTSLT